MNVFLAVMWDTVEARERLDEAIELLEEAVRDHPYLPDLPEILSHLQYARRHLEVYDVRRDGSP